MIIMEYKKFLQEHEQITTMNDEEKLILESKRFRDEDLSQKLGSVLAFSGLMIATSTFQLSTSTDSLLYISPDSFLIYLNILGLFVLFMSSIISLWGMTISGKYKGKNKEEVLQEFNTLIVRRTKLLKYSIRFSALGAFLTLFSFFYILL